MLWLRVYQLVTYLLWPVWILTTLTGYILGSAKQLKYKGQLKERLGLDWKIKSTPKGVQCWWFHAVSLGETQAVLALVEHVIKNHPKDRIIFSHMTSTGVELAKKQLGDRVDHLILGPDLNLLAAKRIRAVRPHKLVFVESDVWPSLAFQAKRYGAKVFIVNGRLSDRASLRFCKCAFLAKALWSLVDHCLVQSDFQKQLWMQAQMPASKIEIGGFLKLDRPLPVLEPLALESLKKVWPQRKESTYVLTLSCTHEPEEKELLKKLSDFAKKNGCHFQVMLAPRHPTRFDEVAKQVQDLGFPICRLSEQKPFQGQQLINVLLVDRMGFLGYCYAISDVCLVAGSWNPNIGGHNILEPVLQAVPTLCGPHVYKQKDVWQLANQYDLVRQAPWETFEAQLEAFLKGGEAREQWHQRYLRFKAQCEGSLDRYYEALTR